MKRLVIVGSGIAGVTAAQEARRLHTPEDLSITVIAQESPPSYSRPQLPEVLAGHREAEELVMRSEQWFCQQGIRLVCPAEATEIRRQEKMLRILRPSPKGEQEELAIPYDALILATGASALVPTLPAPQSPAAGAVFSLRTLDDARRIRDHLSIRRRAAAVLGGGLLGLEAARALRSYGVMEVHVMEASGYLLNRQLNRTASEMLRLYLEREEGLAVHTGIHLDTNELKHRSVSDLLKPICGDGMETLLYSMGVKSQIALAKDAALDCGRGIIIDEKTATSDPAIFAAGDCAEFQGITWAIIPAALEQGKKAAQFACWSLFTNPESKTESASPSPYRQTLPRTALTIGRREAVSAGKAVLTPEEENSGRWKNHELGSSGRRGGSRRSEESDTYVNLVEDTESGLIVGGLAFGPEGTSSRWLSQLQKLVGTSLSELIKIGA